MATPKIVERLRSRTPVSIATAPSVLILSGMVGSVLSDLTGDGLPMNVLGLALLVAFGLWLATAVDRLWNMRAREASARMFVSLAITALLLGAGTVHSAIGRDGALAYLALYSPLTLALAYLAGREFMWLRATKAAQERTAVS